MSLLSELSDRKRRNQLTPHVYNHYLSGEIVSQSPNARWEQLTEFVSLFFRFDGTLKEESVQESKHLERRGVSRRGFESGSGKRRMWRLGRTFRLTFHASSKSAGRMT